MADFAARAAKIKVEIKSCQWVWSDTSPDGMGESDEELAEHLSDGWELVDLALTSKYIDVDNEFVHVRTVTLRRQAAEREDSQPVNGYEAQTVTIKPVPVPVVQGLPSAREAVENARRNFEMMPTLNQKYKERAQAAFAKYHREKAPKAEQQERKAIEDVTFIEALASGQYTREELREIGNREAMRAALATVETRRSAAPVMALPMLGEGRVLPVQPKPDAGVLMIEGKATKKGSK